MKSRVFCAVFLFAATLFLSAFADGEILPPERIPLWNGRAPIGNGNFEERDAFITVHRPARPNGAAMIICPGGGYGGLVTGAEGSGIAQWLNQHGIVGIVLEYRLPRGNSSRPILDAQRAIRTARAHADKWGFKADHVGIIGFSAGGHLAATAATHFDRGHSQSSDPIDQLSSRPDFAVLIYPVITMGEKTHGGSRANLLGANASPEMVTFYSIEKQVTDQTAPTFLAHAKDDTAVPPENSRMYQEAAQQHRVASQYLELPSGGHGLNGYKGLSWDAWQTGALKWLAELKFIPAGDAEESAQSSSTNPFPNFGDLANGPQQLRLLPGQREFVFSMYGAPGDLEPLKQLVRVMREQKLGNGFDPGPGPHPNSKPLIDYLATVGWPLVCYSGGEMQIKGGRSVFGREHEEVLSALDRAGVFNAIQLGEWGYYFHNLAPNESWWRDVYGKDFEQFKHLMKPRGLAGYDKRPASKQECYDVVKDYFTSRNGDLLNRVISVTGHSHYEAYVGGWGAGCIGLEIGENIAFTQSKFAFARGASRQWQKPWSVQVSPWFNGACTSSGPLRKEGHDARGLDAGHSLSLYERMWLHAWFAGAAMVTPENSISSFFEKAEDPWTLTTHGRKGSELFQFMKSHNRGVPFMPVAIVMDHLAGYNGYMDKPWGILEPTTGDRQLRDLFDHQLFPGSDHIHTNPFPSNPELSYLRPTPFGEIFDMQLTSASAEILASYRVILLAGDIEFGSEFIAKLERALKLGRKLLLSPAHQTALGSQFARLVKYPGVEVLQSWTNPVTGRLSVISNGRLDQLAHATVPIELSGDPIQYQINHTPNGWVVELINNNGVIKRGDQPAIIDANAIARVTLRPKGKCLSANEWKANRTYPNADEIHLEVGPGQSAFVEFISYR